MRTPLEEFAEAKRSGSFITVTTPDHGRITMPVPPPQPRVAERSQAWIMWLLIFLSFLAWVGLTYYSYNAGRKSVTPQTKVKYKTVSTVVDNPQTLAKIAQLKRELKIAKENLATAKVTLAQQTDVRDWQQFLNEQIDRFYQEPLRPNEKRQLCFTRYPGQKPDCYSYERPASKRKYLLE